MAVKISPEKLRALNEDSQKQVVTKGAVRTLDPKFPVFGTPVSEDLLMYFPRTNMTTTENGSEMGMLKAVLHDFGNGKVFGTSRCLKPLTNELYKDAGLDYDGVCPLCNALSECMELVNIKVAQKMREAGQDPQSELDETMQAYRKDLIGKIAVKFPDEYVTFPVVIFQKNTGNNKPTDDAKGTAKAFFVTWRKTRYEQKILPQLEVLSENPGHPAGLMFLAKYTYDTKGKKANARDAAKNANYMLLSDFANSDVNKDLMKYGEEIAKDFTVDKASEVIVADTYQMKEDLEKIVNGVMLETRQMLATLKAVTANANGAQQPKQLGGTEGALANFGKTATPAATTAPATATPTEVQSAPSGDMGIAGSKPVQL